VLVEMEQRGMLEQAGLQGDLEELLRCPVHVATTCGLRYARESTRKQIEREAIPLWSASRPRSPHGHARRARRHQGADRGRQGSL
jgi:hypothetical protein